MGFGKGGVISGVFWTAQSMAVGGVDRMQGRMTFILVQAVQAQFHSRALQTLQPSRRAQLPRKRDIREIENESLEEECHLARGHRHRCAGFELKLQLGEYSWCCMWRHSNLRCLWIIVLVMWGGLKGRLWSGVLIIDWALQF